MEVMEYREVWRLNLELLPPQPSRKSGQWRKKKKKTEILTVCPVKVRWPPKKKVFTEILTVFPVRIRWFPKKKEKVFGLHMLIIQCHFDGPPLKPIGPLLSPLKPTAPWWTPWSPWPPGSMFPPAPLLWGPDFYSYQVEWSSYTRIMQFWCKCKSYHTKN